MAKSVLVDLTRCIGCRGCQIACKEWNERSVKKTEMYGNFTNPPELNSECFTHIRYIEQEKDGMPVWSFVKDQCLHCKNPACASVCPVEALKKTENGPVTYNFSRCIGCRYCLLACPFYIPKYEWEKTVPWVRKCTFCSDRIAADMTPACIKVCPSNTMFYGEYEDVLKEAENRITGNPGKYVKHIYGKDEAGGTSWLYISAMPFESLGFNMDIPAQKLPDLTWSYISKIPAVIGVVLTAGAISWVITRRNKNMDKEE
ncbi:MAG: 4Fe-4S dicluster domain-containing protein [Nitrospirota bacterium]|nr:4Fe-4S dicluster domain-containing protein [Nitrospirota bacterium]